MPDNLTSDQLTLLEVAMDAAQNAYAPYSEFRVGAAVLDDEGVVYTGANVENASFGLSLCAERAALATACGAGAGNIIGVAVACIDAPEDGPENSSMPCGACRQWMAELAPGAWVVTNSSPRVHMVEDLLPLGFSL